MKYTEDQEKAINHRNGNLQILACAGSGKTEVISRRIAGLVKDGVPKSGIIAFSFTEKSAEELKARIRRHLEQIVPDDPSLGDMYVGTIHSFSLKLLKEIDPSYRKYEVMDDARQAALIMSNYYYTESVDKGIGLNKLAGLTKRGGYWQTISTFLNTINVKHQNSLSLDDVDHKDVRSAIERYEKIAHGYPNYFLDFNTIIDHLIQTLSSDEGELVSVRDRFQYLVIDEYQDVDDKQETLIRLLTNSGKDVWVTAVGDDDQAIYGWRGASVKNILTFSNTYPNVTQEKLSHNFRSTHCIVELANKAIRKIPDTERISKNMVARRYCEDTDDFPETLAEHGDVQLRTFASEEEEADWVANQILALRGTLIDEQDKGKRGIDYSDFAILLRSVKSSGSVFLESLREKGIPAVVKGTGGLFEFDESLLILASFCLLARRDFVYYPEGEYTCLQERETRQFIRERINILMRENRISSVASNEFLEWIASAKEKLDKRNLEKKDRGRLAHRIYPQDIYHEMLAALGIADGDPWPDATLYNLGKISELITNFESVHQWLRPYDLASLCLYLGGWAAGKVDEGGLEDSSYVNAVQIMTVHSAKGLEWPVVFLPRICSHAFPSSRRNSGPEVFLPGKVFDSKIYASGDNGERRLWYVALTRSQKFLYITSPDKYRKKPTDYFKDLEHDIIQRQGDILQREKGIPSRAAEAELLTTTYSELSQYWRCPYEYNLRNLMHFGPGVKESYGYGQQIHNILAEIHMGAREGNVLSDEEVDALVMDRFHLRYTRDGEVFKPLSTLRDVALRSIKRYLSEYPAKSDYIIEAEKGFEFVDKSNNVLINGAIDLVEKIERTKDGEVFTPVCLVDFKTNRIKSVDNFNSVKEAVEDQLRLYSAAAGSSLNFDAVNARAHILSGSPPAEELASKGVVEVVEVDVSVSEKEKILKKVSRTVEEIRNARKESGRFELKGCYSNACAKCDFMKICPGYRKWNEVDKITPRPKSLEDERLKDLRESEQEWQDARKNS